MVDADCPIWDHIVQLFVCCSEECESCEATPWLAQHHAGDHLQFSDDHLQFLMITQTYFQVIDRLQPLLMSETLLYTLLKAFIAHTSPAEDSLEAEWQQAWRSSNRSNVLKEDCGRELGRWVRFQSLGGRMPQ